MKIFSTALFIVVFFGHAVAADHISAGDRIRIGSRVIVVGDAKAKVQDAGDPDSVVDVVNNFGAKIAEDWHYSEHGKDVVVRIGNSGYVIFCGEVISH
jgi:hypothetical protein